MISKKYKTISYNYKKAKSKPLIIIFPRAGATFTTHKKLTQELQTYGSVLFLKSGYFGISYAQNHMQTLEMDAFRDTLHDLIHTLGYKKVILIGESVGAIHALNYAEYYKDETIYIILSNPAIYKRRLAYKFILEPFLKFGLVTSPDTVVTSVATILKSVSIRPIKKLGEAFIHLNQTVGALSYLSCLSEIVNFRHRYETDTMRHTLKKAVILKGKHDKIFDSLCNETYCKNCKQYKEVSSVGHGIIDANPAEIIETLQRL